MGEAAVKAGLTGALIGALLVVLKVVPLAGTCLFLMATLFLWVGVGFLTVHWLPDRREPAIAIGAGGIAGSIAGLIDGLLFIMVAVVQYFWLGGSTGLMSRLPASWVRFYNDAGIPMEVVYSLPGTLFSGGTLCLFNILLAIVVSAVSAAVFARILAA